MKPLRQITFPSYHKREPVMLEGNPDITLSLEHTDKNNVSAS